MITGLNGIEVSCAGLTERIYKQIGFHFFCVCVSKWWRHQDFEFGGEARPQGVGQNVDKPRSPQKRHLIGGNRGSRMTVCGAKL